MSYTQWAAVRTWLLVRRLPPHMRLYTADTITDMEAGGLFAENSKGKLSGK